jgi:hypothetical protein
MKKSHASAAPRKRRRRRSAGKRVASAAGYTVGRARIRRRKLNPRRRHHASRRRRHSNPRFSLGGITNQLVPAFYGAAGAIALDVALGYIPLPAQFKTGYAKHATKIVGALGIGFLASKFMRGRAAAIGSGALTVAVYGLLKDVMVQFAPQAISSKLGDYEEITVGSYMDAASGVGAYLPAGQDAGIGAYMGAMDNDLAMSGMDY